MNIAGFTLAVLLLFQQAYAPADFTQISGATLQARWDNAVAQGRRGPDETFWIAYSVTVRADLHISTLDGNVSVSTYRMSDGIEWIPEHAEPQHVGLFILVGKSDGIIQKTRLIDLSQNFKVHDRHVYWLGAPESAESITLLSALIVTAPQSVSSSLIHDMTLHAGADVTARLLGLARAISNPMEVRKNAMFWLGQEISRQAGEELAKMTNDPETEIQKQAVAAISRRNNDEAIPALIDIAKNHANPAIRKEAIFWLGQKRDDRVLAFFEQMLKK